MKTEQKRISEIKAELFFKYRWPNKNIRDEKECGYFYEWVHRFGYLDPTGWMDAESLKAYEKVLLELKNKNEI